MRVPLRALVLVATAAVSAAACAAAINPATVQDAQTAARVKSALVNDAAIGVHPIEVRVVNGIARLTGSVPSEAAAARAIALARAVPGVVDVRSDLRVGGTAPRPDGTAVADGPAVQLGELIDRGDRLGGPGERRMLAVGLSAGWNGPRNDPLAVGSTVGPAVRLGSGRGFGTAIGFSWFQTDLRAATGPDEVVGRVRVRPVMAGIGYTTGSDRLSVSLSAVAGVAFNSVGASRHLSGHAVPLHLGNSLAWRPGVSLWIDASSRAAFNLSAGYVITRPRLTVFEDGQVIERRLTADTLVLRAGIVYKVF
ncbi:MAG TPA: BON domain-containing protein [Vicinamibacterales bacterium]|nr:BON domain-containing protein [Vicinamibacterales bacterium]